MRRDDLVRALPALLMIAAGCTEQAKPAASVSSNGPVSVAVPALPSPSTAPSFCADTNEVRALACSRGSAARRGDTLAIAFPGSGVARLLDNPIDGEGWHQYRYRGFMVGPGGRPAHHLVDYHGYEWGSVQLIDAVTGDTLTMADFPVPSPDASRLAVAAVGSMRTCEETIRLELWSVAGGTLVREFAVDPFDCGLEQGWAPSDATWRGRDTVTFVRTSVPSDSARRRKGDYDTARGTLARGADGWTLDGVSAARLPPRPTIDAP